MKIFKKNKKNNSIKNEKDIKQIDKKKHLRISIELFLLSIPFELLFIVNNILYIQNKSYYFHTISFISGIISTAFFVFSYYFFPYISKENKNKILSPKVCISAALFILGIIVYIIRDTTNIYRYIAFCILFLIFVLPAIHLAFSWLCDIYSIISNALKKKEKPVKQFKTKLLEFATFTTSIIGALTALAGIIGVVINFVRPLFT